MFCAYLDRYQAHADVPEKKLGCCYQLYGSEKVFCKLKNEAGAYIVQEITSGVPVV